MFEQIFAVLANQGPKPEPIMIEATHLKALRLAARFKRTSDTD